MPRATKSKKTVTPEEAELKKQVFRNFCFVDWDVTEPRRKWYLESSAFSYVIIQHELTPSNKTPHLQGYAELKKQCRWNAMKKLLGDKVSYWKREGTAKQAALYCTPEHPKKLLDPAGCLGWWESGTMSKQGERKDRDEFLEALDVTSIQSLRDLSKESPATWAFMYKAIDRYIELHDQRQRMEMPDCYCFWGEAGSGKSMLVNKHAGNDPDTSYRKIDGKWFDGYHGQDILVFDDFYGVQSGIDISLFLKITDRYPLSVEVKGSTVKMLATKIYFTSNMHPEAWYPGANPEQIAAILRRFRNITKFERSDLPDIAKLCGIDITPKVRELTPAMLDLIALGKHTETTKQLTFDDVPQPMAYPSYLDPFSNEFTY